MNLKNSKSILPNIITLTNLALGMIAILLVVKPSPDNDFMVVASFLVMFAALTDRIDGKVARRLNAVSELGKELDSLADMVSFGIAPIVIAWKMSLMSINYIGLLICIIYPLAGAFRLARFNTTKFDNVFTGIPITIAGALMSLINLINLFALLKDRYTFTHTVVTAVVTLLLSFLMVSKIKIEKK
ncbi:MAG: CDP-diacylglycerol--serine O-phosphatidyltransferase [Saccharofermentanales bacterium]